MKRDVLTASLIAAAAWMIPAAALAVAGPPLPDASPFFGWLAVPVVAVAGKKLMEKRDNNRR